MTKDTPPPKKASRKKTSDTPSIYDVAREAGVSVFSVSSVINNKSHVSKGHREKVEAAIQKLHYRPNLMARGLAQQKTLTIGMIVPDIANPFFPMVVRGAEDAAQMHGYNLLLCNSDDSPEKEEKALELFISRRIDGIILTKTTQNLRPALREMIRQMKIPIVLIMRTYPSLTRDAVVSDDYQGAFAAAAHLAKCGRKRIGLVSGPLQVSNAKARWQGFHDALKEHGLAFDPDLVVEGNYRIDSGFRAGHTLLAKRPDGVYVANYLMTIGLLEAAAEMGVQCPEDFGLVSFDDYPWLRVFRPRLTTVELPKHQLGSEAVECLVRRMNGDTSKAMTRKLPVEMRIRESCGFASFKPQKPTA